MRKGMNEMRILRGRKSRLRKEGEEEEIDQKRIV